MSRQQVGIPEACSWPFAVQRLNDKGRKVGKIRPRDAYAISGAEDGIVAESILELNARQDIHVALASGNLCDWPCHIAIGGGNAVCKKRSLRAFDTYSGL